MKNKVITLIFGIIFSIIPMYLILGWIYVFQNNIDLPQLEKVAIYNDIILFNTFTGRYSSLFLALFFGFVSEILLILSFNKSTKITRIVTVLFLIINSIFIYFTLLGLM